MEARDARGEAVYLFGTQFAALRQVVERVFRREAAHLHRVFERSARTAETRRIRTAGDPHDTEVIAGSQTPVQPHLLVAGLTAQRKRAEIEESEIDGFLDLVGVIAGEQHPGDMRLDQPHLADGMAVAFSLRQQRPDKRGFWLGIHSAASFIRNAS